MTRPAISDIEHQYAEECYYGDTRAAAEYAYALAVRLRDTGATDEARQYAKKSLHHARDIPTRSLDDVVSDRTVLCGVPIPERFHEGVVRSRLADLLGTGIGAGPSRGTATGADLGAIPPN